MKVPYHLRWLPTSAPAQALLLPGGRVEDVLHVCAEIGADPLPAVYAVADGFLLMLPEPSEEQVVGAVRLRGLVDHLLLPVNAELIPPLLPDESAALVRKRGLIFLPGSRVLEFDRAAPIPLDALIQLGPLRYPECRAIPEPPMLAEAIVELTMVGIDTTPEQILEQGGEGIGDETPTPQDGGMPSQVAGKALFQIGKGLGWLGSALHSPKLAGLGASLLGGAMSLMPSLSEKLMGAQEAMLRRLLEQFRAGNIDDALKRALPLGGDPARGSGFAQNARLPSHNLFYSLINLLGNSGGPGAFWQPSDQTYYELLNEYRKQAELAVSRGDFRRAAFIHAKLLNDFHTAARILSQGGLHRDAAILYEKKLQNPALAAKEWEAAGEIDRAVQLYRKVGDHLCAGDLLRRIGAEDQAVDEYKIAAAKLLESGPRHYEAGELLRVRGQRPDLARRYYEQGWKRRPAGSALSCATRLAEQDAVAGQVEPFLAVLTEAEEFLDGRDPQTTAGFLTEIARLARTPTLAPIADEVHDRALVGIARKMKQSLAASPGQARALANLLKEPSVWPIPLIGDAEHALQRTSKRARPTRTAYPNMRVGRSTVTAVCQTPIGNEVFLGFENGDVVSVESAAYAVQLYVTCEQGPIRALAVDPSKAYLLVLSERGPDQVCLRTVNREIGFRSIAYTVQNGPAQLATAAVNSQAMMVLLQHGYDFRHFSLPNLVAMHSFHARHLDILHFPTVVHGTLSERLSSWWVLAIENAVVELHVEQPAGPRRLELGWDPSIFGETALKQPAVHVVQVEPALLQITGLDNHGGLHRSTFYLHKGEADTLHFNGSERYSAFACVRSDLLAGVHVHGIDWWTPGRVKPVQTRVTLTNPVAALPLPEAGELLIIEADGKLTRVPVAE